MTQTRADTAENWPCKLLHIIIVVRRVAALLERSFPTPSRSLCDCREWSVESARRNISEKTLEKRRKRLKSMRSIPRTIDMKSVRKIPWADSKKRKRSKIIKNPTLLSADWRMLPVSMWSIAQPEARTDCCKARSSSWCCKRGPSLILF